MDLCTGRIYNHTGYDLTIYFRLELIDVRKTAEKDARAPTASTSNHHKYPAFHSLAIHGFIFFLALSSTSNAVSMSAPYIFTTKNKHVLSYTSDFRFRSLMSALVQFKRFTSKFGSGRWSFVSIKPRSRDIPAYMISLPPGLWLMETGVKELMVFGIICLSASLRTVVKRCKIEA